MSEKPAERSANIFVNYRREDSAGHAGRLFDRLSGRFPGRVFMDVDTLEPGVDFVEAIEQAVGACEVLIVLIGHEWLGATDATGRRRLDDPADFVRLEVATALDRKIRVIPVLVQGASMPRVEELPPDLVKLARRNAIELSDARWAYDVDRLIHTIEAVLQELEPFPSAGGTAPPGEPVPRPSPASPLPPTPAGRTMRPAAWMVLLVLMALPGVGWLGWKAAQRDLPVSAPVATPSSKERPVDHGDASVSTANPSPVRENPAASTASTVVPAPASNQQRVDPKPAALVSDTCKEGFVWREARPGDHVCVTPETRRQAAEDNRLAAGRRDPAGQYGPNSCRVGYVWRDAFENDVVCVTPGTRRQARADNDRASGRRVSPR
jgi:hypothetical protein